MECGGLVYPEPRRAAAFPNVAEQQLVPQPKIEAATKRSPLSQTKRNLNRSQCRDRVAIGPKRWPKSPAFDRFYRFLLRQRYSQAFLLAICYTPLVQYCVSTLLNGYLRKST